MYWVITMEFFFKPLRNINFASLPLGKILVTVVILTLVQALRRFLMTGIIKSIENFTARTKTTLGDELIQVLKPYLGWFILVSGFWFTKAIWVQEIGIQLGESIDKVINYILVFIGIYVIYRCSSILGQLIANMLLPAY
jgi:MscS family membrane protein